MRASWYGSAAFLPAILVIVFLFFDASLPFIIARLPNLLAVLMLAKGVVIAETWLLAVWAALVSSPWIRRVGISLALSVVGVGLFEHGLIYIVTWGFSAGIREVFLAPIEFIGLMFPLLVLRVWRGWRLISEHQAAPAGVQRFSLAQLLSATALVAAAIAFGQLGVAELPNPDFQRSMLISACVTCLILSVVAVVPLTWLCFRVRFSRAVGWLASLAVATNGVAIALMCRYWSGGQLDEGFAGLAYCDAVPLTFVSTLLLLRRVGRFALVSGCLATPPEQCL